MILGDNIFETPIREAVDTYRADPEGAMVLLKEVDEPERFGVAELQEDRVVSIVEKPSEPESNLAVTGCYFYDGRVFEIVHGLSPSGRGELEITDVNNRYVEWGALRHHVVSGWWTDAGYDQVAVSCDAVGRGRREYAGASDARGRGVTAG